MERQLRRLDAGQIKLENWFCLYYFRHDNTHVSNGFGVLVNVLGTHSGGEKDLLRTEPNTARNVPTAKGTVSITVYDPDNDGIEYERLNLPSDISVVVRSIENGKTKLRRVKYGSLWNDVAEETSM